MVGGADVFAVRKRENLNEDKIEEVLCRGAIQNSNTVYTIRVKRDGDD